METLEDYLFYNKEEIDAIRFKINLGIRVIGYIKIKKFCFITDIDRHGFKFNWKIAFTNLVSWEEYDGIIQRASDKKD